MAACAEQAQTNNADDNCHTFSAQATMCRVKKYLGVGIGIASESASRAVPAFFFEKNGISNTNKYSVFESMLCN